LLVQYGKLAGAGISRVQRVLVTYCSTSESWEWLPMG